MASPECIHLGRGTLGTQRHVCAFFRTPEEEYEILLPFIREGFERGEKALHVLSPEHQDDHLKRLQAEGIDTESARTRGQFDMLPWRDTYLPDGRFDKHRMVAALEDMLYASASQGYDRTRLVAHPQWGAEGMPRTPDWVEYEMSLNEMLQQHQEDVVVCTYDREALEPERVVEALRSHPMLLIGGVLQENPFYMPPVELLTRLREKDAEQLRVRDLDAAARIQRGLMGLDTLQVPFAYLQGMNHPCFEVGGDFFSIVPVDDGVAAVVADVSGKGVSAAILASLLQGIIYEAMLSRVPLAELAQSVNRFLCSRDLGSKYATLFIARLQPDGALEYLNCAHVPPLVVTSGQVRRLFETNLPVGLLSQANYASAQTRLEPGDRLIIVTDGLTEAANSAGEFFGDDRLVECAGVDAPIEQLLRAVHLFCGDRAFDDDCTALSLTFLGARQ